MEDFLLLLEVVIDYHCHLELKYQHQQDEALLCDK